MKANLSSLQEQIKTNFDLISAGQARLIINPERKNLPNRLKALLKIDAADKGQVLLYAEKGSRLVNGKPVELFLVTRKLDIEGNYIDSAVFHTLRGVVQENVPGVKGADIESSISVINHGLIDRAFDEIVVFGKFDDETFASYLTQLGLVRDRSVLSKDLFETYMKQGSIASYTVVVRTEAEKKKLVEETFEDPKRIIVSEQPFSGKEDKKPLFIVTFKQAVISESRFLAAERFKAILRQFSLGGWEKSYGKVSPADYYTAKRMQGYLEPFFSAEARAIQTALYLDETIYKSVASRDIEFLSPSQLPHVARYEAVDSAFLSLLALKKVNVDAGLEFFRKNNYLFKIKFDNTAQKNIQEVVIYTVDRDNADSSAPQKVLAANFKNGAISWNSSLPPAERARAYSGLQYLLAMLPISFDLQKVNKSGMEMLVNSAFQLQVVAQQEASYDKRPIQTPEEIAQNAADAKNLSDQLSSLMQKHNLNGLQREAFLQLLSLIIVKDQKLGSYEMSSRYQAESKAKALLDVLCKFNELSAGDKRALITEIRNLIENKSTQNDRLRRLAEKVGFNKFDSVNNLFVAAIFQLNTSIEWNLAEATAVINALPEAMALVPDNNYFKLELGVSSTQGTMELILDQSFADRLKKTTQETMRQSDQIVDDLNVAQAIKESPLGKLLQKRNLSSATLIQIALELTGKKDQLQDIFFGTKTATTADLPAINDFLTALYTVNLAANLKQITTLADKNQAAPALVENNIFQIQVAAAHLEKNDALISPTAYLNEELVLIEGGAQGNQVVNQRFFVEEIAEKAPGLILLTYSAQQSKGKVTMQISRTGTLASQNLPVSRLWEIYNMHAVNDDPNMPPKQMQLFVLGLDDSQGIEFKAIRDKLVEKEGADSLGVRLFSRMLQDISAGQSYLSLTERAYLRKMIKAPEMKEHQVGLAQLYGEIEVREDALSELDSKILLEFISALEKGYFGAGANVSIFLSPLENSLTEIAKNLNEAYAGKSLDEIKSYTLRLAQALGEPADRIQNEASRENLVQLTAELLAKLNNRTLDPKPENPYFPKGILNKLAVFTASKIVTSDQLREERGFQEEVVYTLQEYSNLSSLFHSVLSVVTQGQSPMGLGQDVNVVARIKAQIEPEKAQFLFAKLHEQVLLKAIYQSVDQHGNLILGSDGKHVLIENLENGFRSLGVDLANLSSPDSDYLKSLLALYVTVKTGKTSELQLRIATLETAINALVSSRGGSAKCEAADLLSQWLDVSRKNKGEVSLNIQKAMKERGLQVDRQTRYFQSEKLPREFLERLAARLGNGNYFFRQLTEKATESVLPHPVFKNNIAPLTDVEYFLGQKLEDAAFEGFYSLTPGPADTPNDINLKAKLAVLFYTMSLQDDLSADALTQRVFTNWLNQTIGRDEKSHLGRYLKFINKTILAPTGEVDYTVPTVFNSLQDDDIVVSRDLAAFRDNLQRYYQDIGAENLLTSLKSEIIRKAFKKGDRLPKGMIRGSIYFGRLQGENSYEPKGDTPLSTVYFVYLLEDYLAGGERNLCLKPAVESKHYQAFIADLDNIKKLLDSGAAAETTKPALEKALHRFTEAVKKEQIILNPNGYLQANPFSKDINLFDPGHTVFDQLIKLCDENGGRMELSKKSYFNEGAVLGEIVRQGDKIVGDGAIGSTIELNKIFDDLFAFGFGRNRNPIGSSIEVGNPDAPQTASIPQQLSAVSGNVSDGLKEFFIDEPKAILTNQDNWTKKSALYRAEPSTIGPRFLSGYLGLYFSMGNIVDIAALRTITDQFTQPVSTDTWIKAPIMTLAASMAFVKLPLISYLQAIKYLREGDIPEFVGALIASHHVASYTFKSWDNFLGKKGGDFMRKYDLVRYAYDAVDKRAKVDGSWGWKAVRLPVNVIRVADNVFAIGADRLVGAAMWPVKLPAQALSHVFPGAVVSFADTNGERTLVINGKQHAIKKELIDKLNSKYGKRGLWWIRATRDFEAPIVEKARKNFVKAGLSVTEIEFLLGTEANSHSGLLRSLKNARRGFWKISRGLWWRQFTSLVHPYADNNTFMVKSTGKIVAGPELNSVPATPVNPGTNPVVPPAVSKPVATPVVEAMPLAPEESTAKPSEKPSWQINLEMEKQIVERVRNREISPAEATRIFSKGTQADGSARTPEQCEAFKSYVEYVEKEALRLLGKPVETPKPAAEAVPKPIKVPKPAAEPIPLPKIIVDPVLVAEAEAAKHLNRSSASQNAGFIRADAFSGAAKDAYKLAEEAVKRAKISPEAKARASKFMGKHWQNLAIYGMTLIRNKKDLVSKETAKELAATAAIIKAFKAAENGLAKYTRLGNSSGVAAAAVIPALLTAYEYKGDLASGNGRLASMAAANVALNAAKGAAAMKVGAMVGGFLGAGVPGAVAGFAVTLAGYEALDHIQSWTDLDEEIDDFRGPARLTQTMARFGTDFETNGYTTLSQPLGIVLATGQKDPDYFDHDKGLEITIDGKKQKISQGQAMLFYIDQQMKENGAEIAALGISEIKVPKDSDFTPELFDKALEAARAYKLAHPDCRDLKISLASVRKEPVNNSVGETIGQITVYELSITAQEHKAEEQTRNSSDIPGQAGLIKFTHYSLVSPVPVTEKYNAETVIGDQHQLAAEKVLSENRQTLSLLSFDAVLKEGFNLQIRVADLDKYPSLAVELCGVLAVEGYEFDENDLESVKAAYQQYAQDKLGSNGETIDGNTAAIILYNSDFGRVLLSEIENV
ncbi:MAG: hypothetical protein ABIH50_04790 [bacterium]